MYSLKNLLEASPARLVSVIMSILILVGMYGFAPVPDPDKLATSLTLILTVLAGGEITRANAYSKKTVKRITGKTDPAA